MDSFWAITRQRTGTVFNDTQNYPHKIGLTSCPDRYWEVVELGRKLMLSGFVSFMGAGSIAQSVVATLISFFFFAWTFKQMPFEAQHLNMIKIFTEFQIFGILLVCIVLQTNEQGFAAEAITINTGVNGTEPSRRSSQLQSCQSRCVADVSVLWVHTRIFDCTCAILVSENCCARRRTCCWWCSVTCVRKPKMTLTWP